MNWYSACVQILHCLHCTDVAAWNMPFLVNEPPWAMEYCRLMCEDTSSISEAFCNEDLLVLESGWDCVGWRLQPGENTWCRCIFKTTWKTLKSTSKSYWFSVEAERGSGELKEGIWTEKQQKGMERCKSLQLIFPIFPRQSCQQEVSGCIA